MDSMSPVRLRVGLDDYLVVGATDILRVHDRRHAARLLEDEPALTERERDGLVDQLAAGTAMLVRAERHRPQIVMTPVEPSIDLRWLSLPAPALAPTWLEIEVRHESGAGYPRASFILELPDGTERTETLDDDSRWRATDIPPAGTCRVRFESPLRLASATEREERSAMDEAEETRTTLVAFGTKAATLASAARHMLVVPRSRACALQVGDVHFGSGCSVVMPTAPAGASRDESTPLDAVAAALAHVATTSPRPFTLVAGHTDTAGSDALNDRLSAARAVSVDLLLRGDKGAWAGHAQEHHSVRELQRILQWAAVRQGWACDPGAIDSVLGPRTAAARRAFREGYNHESAGALDLDADTNAGDWAAVFELYAQELAILLSELGGPEVLWPVVRSRSLGTVACGERWPVEAVAVDGYACEDNRRVEILFFEIDDLPDLSHDVPGFDLYGTSRYRFEPVPARPRIRLARVQLRDAEGRPLPSAEYELSGVEGAHVGTTDGMGFTERFLAAEGAQAIVRVGRLRYGVTVASGAPTDASDARSTLNALGHFAGRLDGGGGHTRAAIRNFQWVRGLPITGELDATTSEALRRASGS